MAPQKFSLFLICLYFISCGSSENSIRDIKSSQEIGRLDSILNSAIERSDSLSKYSSDHASAIDLLKRNLTELNKSNLNAYTYALGHHKLGTYFYRTKEIPKALAHLDTAINLWGKPSELPQKIALANSYYVAAVCHSNESFYSEALKNIQKASTWISEVPDQENTKGNYFAKTGYYFHRLGENVKAAEYFDQANALLDTHGIQRAEYLDYKGRLLEANGKSLDAVKSYEKSIQLYRSNKVDREIGFAAELNLLGILQNGKPYDEIKKVTLEFLSDFNPESRYLLQEKCLIINNLAYDAYDNNNLLDSRKYYSEALAIAKELSESENTIYHGLAYEGLGDVELGFKNYDTSIEFYHKAIQCLSIGFDSKNINSLPNLKDHVIIHAGDLERMINLKIDAIYEKFLDTKNTDDLKLVLESYRGLDLIWTQMRQGYKAAASRFDLVEKNAQEYEKATNVALELHRLTQEEKYINHAYNFATKNKAIVMLDGLQNEEAKFSNIDEETLGTEIDLKREIYNLDSKIFELSKLSDNKTSLAKYKKERFHKSREYERLIAKMEVDHPSYHQLKYNISKELDYKSQQKNLPNKAAVIEYFVGKDSIYIFSYSKQSPLKILTYRHDKDFDASIEEYCMMNMNTSNKTIEDFSRVSKKVYDLLLKDVIEELDDSIERLFIIPDGKLMQVSFDVLLTEEINPNGTNDWTMPLPYLLRKYALSYAYNNQLLFDDTKSSLLTERDNSYLGFGLEYDDFTLEGVKNLLPVEVDTAFTRGVGKLVYSVDEILESASIMNGQFFLNEKATRELFLTKATDVGILHLAMHGFVAKEKPLNSGLIFTRRNSEDEFVLKASDLYTMKLEANLSVLSACHTGDGLIEKGEGIRSIARAFNYAGCSNITASLWAAPDLSTKKIILKFFENLKKKQSIDVALQQAKLQYLDQCKFSHEALPHLWSHLLTIGDTGAIFN